MPKQVTPKSYIIAETTISDFGIADMLKELGASNWSPYQGGAAESLTACAAKLCYRSFNTDVNLNLERVREDQQEVIANILRQKHGSVLEHATVSVAFLNVSRVFTHELVRHRIGGISQESMRYVRLDELPYWVPPSVDKDLHPDNAEHVRDMMGDAFAEAEKLIRDLGERIQLEKKGKTLGFSWKKQWTSFLRRFIPHGVATNIIFTTNHRQWRHIFTMRGSAGAEEEMQFVMLPLFRTFKEQYPGLYQDMEIEDGQIVCSNGRV